VEPSSEVLDFVSSIFFEPDFVTTDFGATAAHFPSVSCYKKTAYDIIRAIFRAITSVSFGFHLWTSYTMPQEMFWCPTHHH
jgi:hypothetical protein